MSTEQVQSSTMGPSHDGRPKRMSRATCVGNRYGISHEGHDIELEFNQRPAVLNRARLAVDGKVVAAAQVA